MDQRPEEQTVSAGGQHGVFNRSGEIESLYDKETGTEWAAGTMNVLNLYQDIPSRFEAWDIDSMRKKISWEDDTPATITAEEQGSLFCEIRVEKSCTNPLLPNGSGWGAGAERSFSGRESAGGKPRSC